MSQLSKLVIVGGGTAGWMAAAAFGKMLKGQLDITIIESDDIPTVGVGEATIPPLQAFHRLLGIDEQAFLKSTNGTFKLGIQFSGWGDAQSQYFHSFGSTGKGFWAGDFQHIWLRGQEYGVSKTYSEYCLETQAALSGKFTKEGKPKINYAYHLDAGLYAKFLREFSEQYGVKRIEGFIDIVDQDPVTRDIKSVRLRSGKIIEGDFFIDCSGFKGLLIEQALHAGYEDWSHWLLCDRAVAMQTSLQESPKPFTQSVAYEGGWRWRIPLQNRVGNGVVYSSKYWSDEKAQETLLQSVDGEPLNEPRVIPFKPGRRLEGWKNNCVALGLASGFIEPLESTSIHLVMTGIMRLLILFPHQGEEAVLRNEYNMQLKRELEDVRDFIIAHYKVNTRGDGGFWQHCRNMPIPESLQQRLDLFKGTAQLFKKEDELFRVDSWTQVLIGQGLSPTSFHLAAEKMPENDLREFLQGYHEGIRKYVSSLPTQAQFIEKYCRSD